MRTTTNPFVPGISLVAGRDNATLMTNLLPRNSLVVITIIMLLGALLLPAPAGAQTWSQA